MLSLAAPVEASHMPPLLTYGQARTVTRSIAARLARTFAAYTADTYATGSYSPACKNGRMSRSKIECLAIVGMFSSRGFYPAGSYDCYYTVDVVRHRRSVTGTLTGESGASTPNINATCPNP
ncbi:MAG: hypothetical protein NVS4B2_29250 [Chloroflexota bacterium]